MSSLWTPSGEHFPEKDPADATRSSLADTDDTEPSPEEAEAAMEAMRAQLAQTPADVVIANHCYGLFELAAIYLSQTPPILFQARLAIDALGAVLDGLAGRLGEAEPQLRESLSQLRLAFVSLEGAEQAGAQSTAAGESGESGSGASPN
jgi:hypothetical protein